MSLDRLLTPERALLFRITHRDNIPHILCHGLQCRSSQVVDPKFVEIGNPDLIEKRKNRSVPVAPGGTLADYVPFYFTPCTPMLYNIVTGRNVAARARSEVVILVTSIRRLEERSLPYVVSDRHAYVETADFASDRSILTRLPWAYWQARDFRRNLDEPDKFERLQAEALVYKCLPTATLGGIVTYDVSTERLVAQQVAEVGASVAVHSRPSWYV